MSGASNGFIRSKIKDTVHFAKFLAKLSLMTAGKPNAFNVDFQGNRFHGEFMTAYDLTTDPTKVTFSHGGFNYEFLLADIQLVRRLRSRKYTFKVNVLTIV
jgi:hypothetical protein